MRLALAILSSLLSITHVPSLMAAEGPAAFGHTEAIIEPAGARPYPEELVLLKIRSVLIQTHVADQELEQPALENFSWKQLIPDRWYKTNIDGAPAIIFERILALFPGKSGRLTIDPFIHHLIFTDIDNQRRQIDLRSDPVDLEVVPWAGTDSGPSATKSWWLPSSALTVTDLWTPEPEGLSPGETAHRTVIIEARGVSADRLPPAPELRSPGIITFRGMVERVTDATPDGPVARATYRWDVRPTTAFPAMLEAIHIPWFDTKSREMRDAIIPARRVFFAAPDAGLGSKTWKPDRFALIATGVISFAVALAILLAGSSSERDPVILKLGRYIRAQRDLRVLRRAARSHEPREFRSAIYNLSRLDPARWNICQESATVASGVTALDDYLFGSNAGSQPDIRALSRAIVKAWIAASIASAQQDTLARA